MISSAVQKVFIWWRPISGVLLVSYAVGIRLRKSLAVPVTLSDLCFLLAVLKFSVLVLWSIFDCCLYWVRDRYLVSLSECGYPVPQYQLSGGPSSLQCALPCSLSRIRWSRLREIRPVSPPLVPWTPLCFHASYCGLVVTKIWHPDASSLVLLRIALATYSSVWIAGSFF